MSDSHAHDQEIAARAADFVARLSDQDASEADWEALTLWLEESDAHRHAYNHAELVWRDLSEHRQAVSDAVGGQPAQVRPFAPSRRRPPRRWIWAAGGLAAVAATIALVMLPISPPGVTYVTRPGERREISLADGSRISLNGASRITVRLGRERRVEMADAEAVFDVAHDPARPFIVSVGDSQIRDVGTVFDIRRNGARTRVTVARGAVDVVVPGAPGVRLGAGEALDREDRSGPGVRAAADPAAATAWRSGRLIYQHQALSVVAEDLSRAFSTRFIVAADSANLRFTGVIVLDDADAVSRRIQAFLPVIAVREGGTIEIRRRH